MERAGGVMANVGTFYWVAPTTGDGDRLGRDQPANVPDLRLLKRVFHELERVGFEGVLIPSGQVNNHFGVTAPYLDAVATAGAAAACTRELKLLIAIRPGLVHPGAAARALATIDVLSGGRAMLNLVCGAGPLSMYREQIARAARYYRAAEFADFIDALWRDSMVDYEGHFFQAEHAVCFPHPNQIPRPPMFVAGASDEAIELAIARADIMLTPGSTRANIQRFMERFAIQADRRGRRIPVGTHFYVVTRATGSEALSAANDLVSEVAPSFLRDRRRIFAPGLGDPPVPPPLHELDRCLWNHLRCLSADPTPVIVGSFDDVAETLHDFLSLGISLFILQGYPMADEIRRVGEEVLPRVAHLAGRKWARSIAPS
jgi:alkanesulfonate monooxygenase